MNALLATGSGTFIYVQIKNANINYDTILTVHGPQTILLIQDIVWRLWVWASRIVEHKKDGFSLGLLVLVLILKIKSLGFYFCFDRKVTLARH